MKKQSLFFGLVLLFTAYALPTCGQGNIAVNQQFGDDELKSASKARSIALTNTVMSIGAGLATVALFDNNTIETTGAALGVYGLLMGPSTGNFYANDYPRGVIGMGVRTVGAYLMIDATSEIFGSEFANTLTVDNKDVSLTDTKVLIGEVLVLGSFIYNVLSTQASVEAYNNGQRRFSINVTPAMVDDKVAPVLTASINL